MTALILLEYRFIKDKYNNIYCDRVIDYNYLTRYLQVFDDIILCGRMSYTEEDCSDKLLVSGKNVNFIPLPDFYGIKGIIMKYRSIIRIIKEIIPKVNCCIMRAPNHLSLITYKLFKRKELPFALEFNIAADKFIENNSFIGKLINKIVVKKTKKMCMTANGVSYVTEHILQDKYPCKAFTNKENSKYFTASYSTIDLTDEMFFQQNWEKDLKPEIFKIVHTGYMDSYRKGQVVLIKAIKEVIKKGYTNIRLILIGDGKKKKEFEELVNKLGIQDYVIFKGMIKKRKDIFEILKNSHMLVFPTQSEGLPRSIIEAMAAGLVCISSPVDGIPELLESDMMIDYNNIEGYSNKIIEMLNNWEKMIEISRKNNKLARKYKKENLCNIRKEFYTNLNRQATLNKR